MGFVYNTAKELDTEKHRITLGKQQGEILAYSSSTSTHGNAMLNLRIMIDTGDDATKEVTGRITFSENTVPMVDRFIVALGRDPAIELGDQVVDEGFLDDWGLTLVGEKIGFDVRMSNVTEEYASRAEINPFAWRKYKTETDLAHLDSLL